ncbi:MAG: TetR family transcriptional regulator [Alphaproteobacteria bacterium]|nr:TetR family transcriptional regulator [Alphaproteobacteria bacterium]
MTTRQVSPLRARTPTGRVSRRHATEKSAETRDVIIDAALRCFHRDGYFRTNLSVVSKEAGVTRGCMQYYFPTTDALLAAATGHLVDDIWAQLTRASQHAPPGVAGLEYHIDVAFDGADAWRYQILVELLAAARTEPSLRPILKKTMQRFDQLRLALSKEIFQDEAKGRLPNFRAASDLVSVLSAGLAIYILPDNPAERRAALKEALKEQVFQLWGLERAPATLKKARRPA